MRNIIYVIIDKVRGYDDNDFYYGCTKKDNSRAWYRFGETVGPFIYWALLFGGGFIVGAVIRGVITGLLRGVGII